jgi:hypothetical protein
MKFLVPNYSCIQNPWLGGCHPQIPVLSVLCSQLNLLNPPPKKNSWVRHCLRHQVDLLYWVLMIDGQKRSIAGQTISRRKATFHRNASQLTCGVHLWDARGLWHVWRRASYKVLVGESDVKRPLLRPSHRLEDNIKKYIKETGWDDVDWIDVAQVRAK